ncbi:ribose transport system ATP-binding protein [Monaibacterium marinum]|uniref:Ribose transport system ATP-binding protein n=1 Tax=Pontivivens marinum TaxID=1690039 RepID=A0A2C9CLQ8_9RHOB|nr:sugar ABC transporter ATP-binding protein [Monaibacterium marinum]SOH92182.1 ribose transport system ATP-binding protein [Monaibacterium marinum]
MGLDVSGDPVLSLNGVCRDFGQVRVLHSVDFALHAGAVHALIGENGAGKSTCMKILGGYLSASDGAVRHNGQDTVFASAQQAESDGVVMIHQEFNLAEQLSVEQNIFLGRELRKGVFLDHAQMRKQTQDLLDRLETRVDPAARVEDISVSDKQMVEIAKALSRNARVLIMDEPTAVLTNREAAVLFRQIERLRADGVAILYTSHKLDEIARLADMITVLRDGRVVAHGAGAEFDEDRMARDMVGRDLTNLYPDHDGPVGQEPVLEVENLTVPGLVEGLSFNLAPGEVLGFAGLVGSGRTEAMEGLMGLRAATGTIRRNGQPVTIRRMSDATQVGLGYLTEDRKGRGLILSQGMRPNLTLLALRKFVRRLIDRRAEEAALDTAITEFDIRAPHRDVAVGNLSGGNQQKLLLAKTMLNAPEIVIIDEPTRGIDIGTKQQIYAFIRTLAEQGRAVIVISSEMAEVIGLADRVVVMRQGRKAGELTRAEISEDSIVRLAMGLDGKDYAA